MKMSVQIVSSREQKQRNLFQFIADVRLYKMFVKLSRSHRIGYMAFQFNTIFSLYSSPKMVTNVLENFRIARNKIDVFSRSAFISVAYITDHANRHKQYQHRLATGVFCVMLNLHLDERARARTGTETSCGKTTTKARNFTNLKVNARNSEISAQTILAYTYHPQRKVSWCFYVEKTVQEYYVKVWLAVPKHTNTRSLACP